VLVLPDNDNAYDQGAGLALDAIVLIFNVLSRSARLDTDV